MREIVLDTETTGLDPNKGDRVIEIGCVELLNRIPTGREFHRYINPERDVPAAAEAVHGLSTTFLLDKPLFSTVATDFADFIADDPLVIHNAAFDVGFLNAEFKRLGHPRLVPSRIVDTLELARRKHPAGPNSLDALCKRYGVDNSKRTRHGALMDSWLLAEVYVELLGERQAKLVLSKSGSDSVASDRRRRSKSAVQRPQPLPSRLTAEDLAAHRAFVASLGANAIWLKLEPEPGKG
ncbi:MAG: DNA polymerase III subunit epsilon [Hyphomicrobium sp.]